MEKPISSSKSKGNKIMRFLPKSVSFQYRSYSPARDIRPDSKPKTPRGKVFTGPMIPAQARQKPKNFETQEPTSPKISCMGQIKHKNKMCRVDYNNYNELKPGSYSRPEKLFPARPEKIGKARSVGPGSELKKKPAGIKQLFTSSRNSVDSERGKPPMPERAPSLSQMRRFASSRDTLASFDWTTARIAPDDDSDNEDEPAVALAPARAGGLALEPRKEINLWKRRTMSQPKPIKVNIVRVQ